MAGGLKKMSDQESLRAAFKVSHLNKDHRFHPDMRRYGDVGEYKNAALECEFVAFCDGAKYALAAQRNEGLAREAELRAALTIAESYVQTAFARAQQKDKLGRKLPPDHPVSVDLSRVLAALASPRLRGW